MQVYASLLLVAVCVASIAALPIGNDPDMWEKSGKFEGDILIHPGQVGKNGMRNSNYYWPNGQMFYTISSSFSASERNAIQSAIDDYNANTCITMTPRTNQVNYVAIGNANSGCYSYVGRIGGAQELNLGNGCFTHGTIMHEMLHAFGFWHMQSTYNRDTYVTVYYENIQAGQEHNFDKYSAAEINDFGVTYDYGSVMHYGSTAFSKNGQPTILPTDPNASIGQRVGLSAKDKQKLESMYNC